MKYPTRLVILLAITVWCTVNGQRPLENAPSKFAIEVNENVDQYWANITGIFQRYIHGRSLEVLREWNRAVERGDLKNKVSRPCLDVIEHIIRHPLDQEWSAKIIDSMSAPPGILSGTTTEFGDYDQCIAIDGTFANRQFVGKYCLATVNIPRIELFSTPTLNKSVLKHAWMEEVIEKWYHNDNYYSVASAVCFPSICRETEIRDVLLAYYQVLNSFDFNVTYCQSREDPYQYDSRIWIALSILAIPWIFIIPGTLFEFLYGRENIDSSLVGQLLLGFSLLSNTRVLFRMVDSKSLVNAQFQFVHGIRAIASIFIIIAHTSGLVINTYNMRVSLVARHPTDLIEISKMVVAQPYYNGALVVLTFFLISGMFLTYWTASAKKLKINFAQYVLLRWLRYSPPLIGMICLTLCLEFLGSGPAFHHDLLWDNLEPCYDGWMSHLFYWSNYKGINKTCGIQTWYISVEMQLHIIAFIFLVAYTRSRRLAFWVAVFFIVLGLILVVSVVAVGLASIPLVHVIVHTRFPPTHNAVRFLFFAPTMNMIPYFIGVIIGQMLLENRIVYFSKSTTRILWAFTGLILFGFPMASLSNAGKLEAIPGNETVANAIAFACMLLLWSLANGWLVYQCVVEPANVLARFLSARVFQPVSRLSFCLYLVHLMTIWYNAFQTRTTISVASMNELYKFVSLSIIQSFILAYILYISFEAPSVNVIKLLMKNELKQKAGSKRNSINEQNDVNNNSTEKVMLSKQFTKNEQDKSAVLKDKKSLIR